MNRFAFLLHPPTADDVGHKFPRAAKLSDRTIERVLSKVPPFKISKITGVRSKQGVEIEGWFIALPRTASQLLKMPVEDAYDLIVKAGRIAEKRGAQIFGLGAFTKVIGDKGVTIANNLKIPVTTGNSYTTASAVETALLGAERMGIDPKQARVAIIGATGSIGAACCHLLAGQVGSLALIARSEEKLQRLAGELRLTSNTSVSISTSTQQVVPEADIVIAVSSATDILVNPGDIKPGAVVCDVARPRNVSKKVNKVRDDVLAIDGGVIRVPGSPDFGLSFGFPPGTAEACMAETMILTCEGRFEPYTLGSDISAPQVLEIADLAKKHGFKVDGFRRFERAINEEEVEYRRKRALLARGTG
ncbi:MAG TPA: shikimate dehydrogenase [Anaerolineae bacterium]|nr:shikimate dehydrogenase [Anaerolineae bacterium]